MPTKKRKEKMMLAIAGMRRLWLERNARTFDKKNSALGNVVAAAIAEFYSRTEARRSMGRREG
jgi:phage-related minor tail protein